MIDGIDSISLRSGWPAKGAEAADEVRQQQRREWLEVIPSGWLLHPTRLITDL
jgi:hypothetical protein